MNKMKKGFLTVGALGAIVAPLGAVIACGTNGGDVIKFDTPKARPAVADPLKIEKADLPNWMSQLILDGSDHSVDDKSFNEFAYKGMKDPEATKYIKNASPDNVKPAGSTSADFVTSYNAAAAKTLLVLPGYLHAAPVSSHDGIKALKNKGAILIDADVKAKNIASIQFKSEQSGFLAGAQAGFYLNENAARFEEGGFKVGTFGGINITPVTSYMGGFQQGIEYFNANKPTGKNYKDIEFIDLGNKSDYFSGGFAPGGGTDISNKLLDKGADLIFPVAGPQTADVNKAIQQKTGSKAGIIGVDTAQEGLYDYVAFSALKDMKEATLRLIQNIAGVNTPGFEGGFGKLAIGTVENGMVGVSDGSTAKATILPKPTAAAHAYGTSDTVKAAAKLMKLEFKY